MNWLEIVQLHTTVWGPLLKKDLTGHDIIEFSNSLPKLRSALGCCVCNKLIKGRVLMSKECRRHYACRGCVGKDREKKNTCSKCEDWKSFDEDDAISCIVESYRKFCYMFLTTERIIKLLEVKHEVDPKFDTFRLIELVQDGIKGLSRARKRKTPAGPPQNKGVVPIEVERKSKKICTSDLADVLTSTSQGVQLPRENTTVGVLIRKVQPDIVQDNLSRPINELTFAENTPIVTTLPLGNVSFPCSSSGQNTINSTPTPGQVLTTPVSAPRPEPPKPGVSKCKSPPDSVVTVKIEVQTTPEKSTNNEESVSPFVQDPLASPARDTLSEQTRNVSAPMLMFSRPMTTGVAASSVSTASITSPAAPPAQFPQAGQAPLASYKIAQSPLMNTQPALSQVIQIANPSGGLKHVALRPQTALRIAGLPGRAGIPVQIIGSAAAATTSAGTSSGNFSVERPPFITNAQVVSASSSAGAGLKRRIIFTTATPHDLQKWPDANKILQFAAGDLSRIQGITNLRPTMISMQGPLPGTLSGVRAVSTVPNVRPVATSSVAQTPLVRPMSSTPNLVTSSQSIMTSNTTPGLQAQHAGFSFVRIPSPVTTPPTSSGSFTRPPGFITTTTTVTRQQVPPVPTTTAASNPLLLQNKRRLEGCKCGNATPTPGKLTCIGQRCACYADRSACSDCKCKGCKNPYVPGTAGKKVVQVTRAVLDPQATQSAPILSTPVQPGSSTTTVMPTPASCTNVPQSNIPVAATIGPNASFGTIQTGIVSSTGQPMPPFQFIPVRFSQQPGHTQYLQISGPQGLQQMPIILSTGTSVQNGGPTGITIQGIPVSGLTQFHQVPIQQHRLPQPPLKTEKYAPQSE